MGASKKWLKTIISIKSSPPLKTAESEATLPRKSSPWRLLTSCHVIDKASILGGEDDDDVVTDGSGKGIQAVVTQAEREEWAAIRIQTAFRAFLARRALSALKGLARLQAAINGQNVHKQSIGSLRSIQTFVRMQARIRTHRSVKTKGGQEVPQSLSSHAVENRPGESEDGWCDEIGSVEEIQARLQQKQEAAIKRERAMAYAFSNQWRANSRINLESLFDYELDNSTWSWIWLDRWVNSPNAESHVSIMKLKSGEGMTGKDATLKKSASVNKTVKPKPAGTFNGKHGQLPRAKSHGATSGTLSMAKTKPNGKKQAQHLKGMHTLKTQNWRSWSNPKLQPIKDVKRTSLPGPARRLQNGQDTENEQYLNGVGEAKCNEQKSNVPITK